MTYCIGLRTAGGVFLAADSAYSSRVQSMEMATNDATTVFGELQGDVGVSPWRYVFDEGLKLHVDEGTVAGFSGHVDTARALIRAYLDLRTTGRTSRDAVRDALISVTPADEEAQVLFAFYDAGMPTLLHANTADTSISEVEGLVQLGSDLSAAEHQWTAKYVSSYLELLDRLGSDTRHLERVYAQLVALLQSYGIHNHLPRHGVGGAFVAAWVTPAGARWQGDHLYVVHGATPEFDDLQCTTMIRNNALCLVNNQTKRTKIVTWAIPSETRSESESRASQAAVDSVDTWDAGAFDYFVSINKSKHVVTVIEMNRQQHHDLISFHAPGLGERLGIVWTADLINLTNKIAGVSEPDIGHMSVYFIPFRALDAELQKRREQFAWERFVEWDS